MNLPIELTKIIFRNFMSFGNQYTEIDLTYPGSTLINGWNKDTNSNNGAGKTTLINGICYALYNKPYDNISLQRLINTTNAAKNTLMEVRLFFKKGDDVYEIYRCRGETTDIRVKINGEEETLDSVAQSDKFIEAVLGISYEIFTLVIIFSNIKQPFLEQSIGNQRTQIEELFRISMLSEKASILKKKIQQTETDINIQYAIIKEQETAIGIHNKHVKEAETRITQWEVANEKAIKKIESDLKEIEGIDFETEQELHASADTLVKEISKLRLVISPLESGIKTLQKELDKHKHELTHLEDAKCPFCLQKYEDAPAKLSELRVKIELKTNKIIELSASFEEYTSQLNAMNKNLALVKSEIKHTNLRDLQNIRTNAVLLQNKLAKLKSDTNPHLDAYESLLSERIKAIDYSIIDELKIYLEHQQFLLKLLVDKNSFIRRRIINKTIPFLNSRLNEYAKTMGLPHTVKFDADMSCTVSEYGRELDFGNLSNGEKKRVNLAMSLAFRDVLHHLHSKFNLLILDEVDGGAICPAGMDAIVKLLKQKNRDEEVGIWMISHKPETIGRFDRDITVEKEHGFSTIRYE